MLLSEAMRLGAMLGPQTYRVFWDLTVTGATRTCAMGAALNAVGALKMGSNVFPQETFPGVLNQAKGKVVSLYPQPDNLQHCVWSEIAHRNNELRMTREQIADWLVESGNDCSSVETAPAQELAAALVSAHMVAR